MPAVFSKWPNTSPAEQSSDSPVVCCEMDSSRLISNQYDAAKVAVAPSQRRRWHSHEAVLLPMFLNLPPGNVLLCTICLVIRVLTKYHIHIPDGFLFFYFVLNAVATCLTDFLVTYSSENPGL